MARSKKSKRPKCLTCEKQAEVRGLCRTCHRAAHRAIKRGVSEKSLIRKGLILAPNITGRPPKNGWSPKFREACGKS